MHEASIIQEMLELAAESARKAGGGRIRRIVIRVGVFSSAVPEALRFAFEAMKEGSDAAEATLDIEQVPALAWCRECRREFEVRRMDEGTACPSCGTSSVDLRSGRELDLVRLELE